MSCPELYSQVKSNNKLFLAGILGARSQFFKGLFSDFYIFVEKSRELSRTVFKSEIGQKNLFFWGRTFWTSLFSSSSGNLCSKVKSYKQKPPHKGDGGWWEGGVVGGVVGWGRVVGEGGGGGGGREGEGKG